VRICTTGEDRESWLIAPEVTLITTFRSAGRLNRYELPEETCYGALLGDYHGARRDSFTHLAKSTIIRSSLDLLPQTDADLHVTHSYFMIDPWFHPWIAVIVTVFIFLGLQLRRGASADILFLAGLVVVTLTGVIDVEKARDGFANRALLTIAGLLVIAAGLRTSGVLDWIGQALLGSVSDEAGALRRIGVVVAASAFMLNTALVAMLMPVFVDWCRRRNLAVSRLLIPLSYLAILGGVCTLVGTSTTLVINSEFLLSPSKSNMKSCNNWIRAIMYMVPSPF